eukprot:TRINITY_DN6198_c1_g2_i1.p1 TRINITY_DN6198_c1_g2~~TRINITY_DN6198_c1_g2_i1.p1  ORF type:complete len:595 (+),score=93.51 TRINITY_DN6198_c1_g2_i1:96-1880(+)
MGNALKVFGTVYFFGILVRAELSKSLEEWEDVAGEGGPDLKKLGRRKCTIQRIDGSSIEDISWFDFREQFTQPVIVQNLINDWPLLKMTKEEFRKRHGHLKANVKKSAEVHLYSGAEAPTISDRATIEEHLSSNDPRQYIFDVDFGEIYWGIRDQYITPKFLAHSVHAVPIVFIGTAGSGAGFHNHDQNWLAQVLGRKLFMVSPPGVYPPWLYRNPCFMGLKKLPSEVKACILKPGDLIFVPGGWYHATCNLDDVTFSTGWIGDSIEFSSVWHWIADGPSHVKRLLPKKLTEGEKAVVEELTVIAARAGQVETLKILEDRGIDVTKVRFIGTNRETPLQHAAQNGWTAVVDYLLSKNAGIEERDQIGWTALLYASIRGHADTVQYLLEKKADIHAADFDNQTALTLATRSGHLKAVKLLTSGGAAVQVADRLGLLPLHYAAIRGHLATLEVILQHKADINAASSYSDGAAAEVESKTQIWLDQLRYESSIPWKPYDWSPLHHAVARGHLRACQYLLDRGANRNAIANRSNFQTPLHLSITVGNLPIVKLLVENKADLESKTENYTPLRLAQYSQTESKKEIVQFLRSATSKGEL